MRYFIVFFDGLYDEGHFRGHQAMMSYGFLNRNITEESIMEEFGYDIVIITNLIEISEQDYVEFLS